MTLDYAHNNDFKDFKRLYNTAFPPEERHPYFFIRHSLKRKKGALLIAKDQETFIGFAYLLCYKDLVYLFFFAIEEQMRGHGYGSEILRLIKEKYKGKRIFLAREPLDDRAENAQQRVKRWEFYKKNGFTYLPMNIIEKNYVFETMSIGGAVSPAEYDMLVNDWCGKLGCKLLKLYAQDAVAK